MPAAPSHSARKTQASPVLHCPLYFSVRPRVPVRCYRLRSSMCARGPQTTAAEQQKMIQDYRETHPEFGKKLEEVHAAWMKDHDSLPSTTSERKEYKALMDKIVGNMGDIMKQAKAETGPSPEVFALPATVCSVCACRLVCARVRACVRATDSKGVRLSQMKKEPLQKYIKEHPEVGRNIVKAKERFMKKYGHAPKSKLEKQDYAHMMKHFVGHVDISVDKELGKKAKAEKLPKEDAAQKQKEEVGDIFKLIDKTVKAFEGKDKKEGEEDANEAEKAIKKALEEKGLQVEVGDDKKMHIHSSVQSASPDDKQKVVSSYTAKHPGVQKKLQEVHKLWRATHSAPPKTPAEEKEYDALLARVVGKLPKVPRSLFGPAFLELLLAWPSHRDNPLRPSSPCIARRSRRMARD